MKLWTTRTVPIVLFVLLMGLTAAVWQEQVRQKRTMLDRHTSDVGFQASRRLEIFVESRIGIIRTFALQVADIGGEGDQARQRFEDLARIMVEDVGGLTALALVHDGSEGTWDFPPGRLREIVPGPDGIGLLEESGRTGRIVLSPPLECANREVCFLAVLPLGRGDRSRGSLVASFDAGALMNECFQHRIRSEFAFRVTDGNETFYEYMPEGGETPFDGSVSIARRSFPAGNRTWTMEVVPRVKLSQLASWSANLEVVLLGFVLSALAALVVGQLLNRMQMQRAARDKALREVMERERTEKALNESRSRYRSIFESATNGIVIMDQSGTIIDANPAACTMHGHEPGELVGKQVRELIALESRHIYRTFRQEIDEQGKVRLDAVNVRRDGSRFDVEVRGTTLEFAGELRLLAILTDLSERKRTEERLAILSRKILLAQEEERLRLSRDLHDELGQLLTAQRLELDWLEKKMEPANGTGGDGFKNAMKLVEDATRELRRICRGLRPPLLDDLGLEPAVHLLVEEFRERTGMNADLVIRLKDEGASVPKELALCTYRILQESITNVSRHSGAEHVDISLVYSPHELVLSVHDNGKGFDAGLAGTGSGSGITGMHERAHLVGGSVDVKSSPEGGTRVVFRAPLGEDREARE